MKAVVPNALATRNVQPIVPAYATSVPILAPAPVDWRLYATSTITFQSAPAQRVIQATPLCNAHDR